MFHEINPRSYFVCKCLAAKYQISTHSAWMDNKNKVDPNHNCRVWTVFWKAAAAAWTDKWDRQRSFILLLQRWLNPLMVLTYSILCSSQFNNDHFYFLKLEVLYSWDKWIRNSDLFPVRSWCLVTWVMPVELPDALSRKICLENCVFVCVWALSMRERN